MRVLCAIGMRDGPEMVTQVRQILGGRLDLLILHVIDTEARLGLKKALGGPGTLRPAERPRQEQAMNAAEEAAGKAALEETYQAALEAQFHAEIMAQRGRPEQAIIQTALDWHADLIVIWASEGLQGRPQIGPASVGHTARFVLDHAPCNVLYLRPAGSE
jgi:nucleotide-binding universal stress UspA family protein